jgi:hypothetical protein
VSREHSPGQRGHPQSWSGTSPVHAG